MSAFFFATLHYSTLIFCQFFNNATQYPSALIVPVGLLIHDHGDYLGPIGGTILCLAIGLLLDATFWFLPFGFSVIFCLFFHCARKLLANAAADKAIRHRIACEQLANILYVFFLFALGSGPFPVSKFLATAALSQAAVFFSSGPMARAHVKIASFCDGYAKYGRRTIKNSFR
ncbi:MAG: hypothetical protein LBI61_03995 [Puniceicoccales bacterium]|jgi:hypothetical protein|nr:hypothetical protein [Puniceicoccales bacterium]